MPVVPFIPLIASGIGAGATIFGAHEAASGAKDAAQTQSDTAAKALQASQQLYQQQRADLAPYRAQGSGAIGKLGSLWGVTPGQDANIPGNPYSTPQTPMPTGPNVVNGPNGPGIKASAGAGYVPPPSGSNLGTLGGQPSGPTMQAGGVQVKAPNGQVYLVPTAQLGDALAHGGQQVNA